MATGLMITLNAPLRPEDRSRRYEAPLSAALEERRVGHELIGGGTLLNDDREPAISDFDLEVEGDTAGVLGLVIGTLEAAGAPKGSRATLGDGEPVPFGTTEGVGLYLNGTDLPDDVYEDNHIDDLIGGLLERLGPDGRMQSWWQGPREMALYFYGPSARRVQDVLAEELPRFPLAQRSRVVPLPLTLPSG
jgi:hypothetical protein